MEQENETNSTDEIEITPEMIEAGEKAFEEATVFASVSGVMTWLLVEDIYIAMQKKCLPRIGDDMMICKPSPDADKDFPHIF